MKVSFITLGCKVNQYESNEMLALLTQKGFVPAAENEEADVYVINSCTVTNESSRKSRQALRKAKKEHPNAVTVLTGCYAQAFEQEAFSLKEADIVLGNNANDQLYEAVTRFLSSGIPIRQTVKHLKNEPYKGGSISQFEGHTRAFIKIQDGCNRYCNYCIIPYARGFSRSKPLNAIQTELTALAQNGYREVVFVGINLSAYGLEIGLNLCDALALAEHTNGIERIRLGSLEPDHITDEMIRRLSGFKKFCPQFHLSLQSGSDAVLKRMNRHYTAFEYQTLCKKLTAVFPDCSLTTDIIVGFPGETDENFNETVAFQQDIGFMKVHVFPFSPREGTPAFHYADQLGSEIKAARCELLQASCDQVRLQKLKALIGKEVSVLFETPKNGVQHGYTKNYTPVRVNTNASLCGEIKNVRVINADSEGCIGELTNA